MKILLRLALGMCVVLAAVWGLLALAYRLPLPQPVVILACLVWLAAMAGVLVALRRERVRMAAGLFCLLFAVLLLWWVSLTPSNDRDWADDVAQMLHGRLDGNQLHLGNVRNFDWRTETDYDIVWEERSYDLARLRSVDMAASYWGLPAIAHIIVTFGFDDGEFLALSVEIRKERHESYSELGGFFKEYELGIVAADERDVLRVRSNVRGEDVYLYRVDMPQAVMRDLLLSYVEQANRLVEQPRFYHTLTANCTTVVFDMVSRIVDGLPMDYRLLLTGLLPGYLHDLDALAGGGTVEQLRDSGRITERALAADDAAGFSQKIRRGVPGW